MSKRADQEAIVRKLTDTLRSGELTYLSIAPTAEGNQWWVAYTLASEAGSRHAIHTDVFEAVNKAVTRQQGRVIKRNDDDIL